MEEAMIAILFLSIINLGIDIIRNKVNEGNPDFGIINATIVVISAWHLSNIFGGITLGLLIILAFIFMIMKKS